MGCGCGGVSRDSVYAVRARGADEETALYVRDIAAARVLRMQVQAETGGAVMVSNVPASKVPAGADVLTLDDVNARSATV